MKKKLFITSCFECSLKVIMPNKNKLFIYIELILYLLIIAQNDKLLIKNYKACPIGFIPFSKVNVTKSKRFGHR